MVNFLFLYLFITLLKKSQIINLIIYIHLFYGKMNLSKESQTFRLRKVKGENVNEERSYGIKNNV